MSVETGGDSLDAWRIPGLAVRTPGRETLVIAEARRRKVANEASAAPEGTDGGMARSELPGASEVM